MIDEYWTWEFYGYHSDELSHASPRRVVAVCDTCYRHRIVKFSDYRDLCRHCVKLVENLSDNTRLLLSESHIGSTRSSEIRLKMSISMTGIPHNPPPKPGIVAEEDRFLIGTPIDRIKTIEKYGYDPIDLSHGSGKYVVSVCEKCGKDSDVIRYRPNKLCCSCAALQGRKQMSATRQGIPIEEWDGFVKDSPYCEKFDAECREHNRNKYDNICFLCGRQEFENITKTGEQRALSVHHYDMNKDTGCDNTEFKLVPLCMHCHPTAHSKMWQRRIEYLLEHVWGA